MLAYIPYMDPMGKDCELDAFRQELRECVDKQKKMKAAQRFALLYYEAYDDEDWYAGPEGI